MPTVPSRDVGSSSGASICLRLVILKPKADRTQSYEVSIGGCPQFPPPHAWERAGRRIKDRVKRLLGDFEPREEDGTAFIWKRETYQAIIPFRSHLQRSTQHIPREEILGLIHENQHVFRDEDPPKAVADLMGLGRLTASTRSRLEACLHEYRLIQPR